MRRPPVVMLCATVVTLLLCGSATASFPTQPRVVRFMRIDSDFELFRMRADGTRVRRVTTNALNDSDARVSPNGKRIVFARQPSGELDDEIYTMWSDGTHVRRLTDNANNVLDQTPNWSPDGTRIVFRSNRLGAQIDLYTMNTDGSDVDRLTNDTDREWLPTWSPDGRWIAFSFDEIGLDQEVARIRSTGGGFVRVTTNQGIDDFVADWSPNGNRLAIWSNSDGDFEIYTIGSDGTGRFQVTRNRARDVYAFWLPSGTRIVFNRLVGDDLEIFSIRPNGTGLKRLTNNRVEDYLVRTLS